MNRHGFIAGLMVSVLGSGLWVSSAAAQGAAPAAVAQSAISVAEKEINTARSAIGRAKELIALIPEDSPMMPDVLQVMEAASENWSAAVNSLKGAKQSAAKIASAASGSVGDDYALLAKVNAGVALSGAKVVQIGVAYIDAVANNKTEALDIIRAAMQDALAASSQVQFNYERVKKLIAEKYSK